jgi:hypothetical protein
MVSIAFQIKLGSVNVQECCYYVEVFSDINFFTCCRQYMRKSLNEMISIFQEEESDCIQFIFRGK